MLKNHRIPPAALIVAIVVIILVALLTLPVQVPSSIEASGRIVPSREWYLLHDRAGRIMAVMNDRLENSTTSLLVHQFERQDAVRFDLNPNVRLHGTVSVGDTIGILSSAEADVQLAQLEGELSLADATARVYETGEKGAIQQEAEKRVAYATRQYEGHQRTVERMKALKERGVISAQEFEVVENASDLYRAEIDVARAQLRSVETGAKPAQQQVGHSGRSSLLGQIRALKRKIDRGILTAPFTGTVLHSSLSDTLFHFGDTRVLAVVFSMPWSRRGLLHAGQQVVLSTPTVAGDAKAAIRSVGNVVHTIRGEQVVLITAEIRNGEADLLPGVIATCSVTCPQVPLRTYIVSYIAKMFGR